MNFGMIILNQNIKTMQNCYMDTHNFIVHIKAKKFYEDIADDVVKWFDTSIYREDDKRPLPRGMNKKVIELMKDNQEERL